MTEVQRRSPFWVRYDPDNPAHAAALAVLRQGFDRSPGDVPGMWPYYVHLAGDGRVSRELMAEHLALCMFGLHQQGVRSSVHASRDHRGRSFASALNQLRQSEKFSSAALDARVSQAATSPTVSALAYHLRGLVSMLKSIPNSQFDYNALFLDLRDWQDPSRAPRVRLRWGIDYTLNNHSINTDPQEGE